MTKIDTMKCRGISNTAGTISGVIGVALTGHLLERAGGATQVMGWNESMALCAVQGLIASVIFIRFARGDRLFGADTGDFP